MPESWISTYATQLSLNRRYRLKEQFTRLERLVAAIASIHERGGQLDMALNAPYFNRELLPHALDAANLFLRLGVNGIVVGSLALLNALRERGYEGIVLSNLLGCYSAEAVAFFVERFRPARVVLPRDLLPEEIARIVSQHPEVAFEVFLFGDHCRLSEAYCFVEHGYDSVVRQDLCGYAATQRRYHRRAVPAFKRVLRDANLSPAEKADKLRGISQHLPDILDDLEVALAEGKLVAAQQAVDRFARLDYRERLADDRVTLCRALNVFRRLDWPSGEAIRRELEAVFSAPPVAAGEAAYLKLDATAIAASIARFAQHPNIVAYKIPARGRDLERMLSGAAVQERAVPLNDFRASLYRR